MFWGPVIGNSMHFYMHPTRWLCPTKVTTTSPNPIVEAQIDAPASTKALFPVGLLRCYLEAQEVDGRELLVFDSDEEVSSEVAARMLGMSRPFLNELLEVESMALWPGSDAAMPLAPSFAEAVRERLDIDPAAPSPAG